MGEQNYSSLWPNVSSTCDKFKYKKVSFVSRAFWTVIAGNQIPKREKSMLAMLSLMKISRINVDFYGFIGVVYLFPLFPSLNHFS